MRVVVLGGAGAMGRVCVADLAASGVDEVVVADRDETAAKEVAGGERGPGTVWATRCDATDHGSLVELLKPADVVANCVNYALNPTVMQAAAEAGTHYLDLGGLYHGTLRQLELRRDVEATGILCLLGMGATPGTTNVMARLGVERLEHVYEMHLRCGGFDPKPPDAVLPAPFAIDTILDEFMLPAIALKDGEVTEVPLGTGGETFDFPAPVGAQTAIPAVHSELATLPRAFPSVKEMTFKVAYGEEMTRRYRLVTDLGLSRTDSIELLDGTRVVPRDVLKRLALEEPQRFSGLDVETLVVVLRGERDGRPIEVRVQETCPPAEEYGVGGADANTGIPPSVAAQMIARGDIRATGVHAPEEVVPPRDYFAELAKRNIEVHVTERPAGAETREAT